MYQESNKNRKSSGRVTLADVAKKVGVGAMTVSRALRTPEMVSEVLRKRIEQVVAELGYVPNYSARQLASAVSQNLVIVTTSITSTENALILSAFRQSIQNAELQMVILIADNDHWLQELINHSPQAIILLNVKCPPIAEQWIIKSEIPTIEIGSLNDNPIHASVSIDSRLAMKTMIDYLISKGCREIGLLAAQQNLAIFQQYLDSWHKTLLNHHISPHLIHHSGEPISYSAGANLLKDAIQNWGSFDALVFLSDELACGALNEALRRKLNVPRDCKIVGLGGLDVGKVSYPNLTTIEIPYENMGKQAGKLLIKLLNNEYLEERECHIILPTTLIERAST